MFSSLKSKFQFHLKFKNRVNAANILAAALSDRLDKKEKINAHILGIPRGGVLVADIVAFKLQTSNFGIIVPRKLTIPNNEEIALGAVMLDGTIYLNPEIEVPSEYLVIERERQIQEIKRRIQLYIQDNTDYLSEVNRIGHKSTVILVDDGIASGATLIVAARWLKKYCNPRRIIVAATVAPKETVKVLEGEASDVEVIAKPPLSNFHFVGQYYQNFAPVTDDQVINVMKERNLFRN